VARFPVENAEEFCQWLLEDYSFEGQTVMMAPANGFYSSKNLGIQEARIAYVLNKESLIKSIEVLKQALMVYPKRIK
jgi:aspartate aminotransferase